MNISEIQLALSLPKELTRIKIVILDNILELFMFQIVRSNAFDEWNKINGDSTPSKRLALFRSFFDKQKYCVQKGVFSQETGLFFNVFHELRNLAYHQAFDNVTNASSSSSYDERFRKEYHNKMELVYSELTHLYAVIIIELFKNSASLDEFEPFNSFVAEKQILKQSIMDTLTDNLLFRIKKLKNDLAYIEDNSNEYDDAKNFHDYQDIINHITFNYGHEIIEKAHLDNRIKTKFLEILHNNSNYVDSTAISEQDVLFTTQEILDWETSISHINQEPTYFASIIAWDKISKKLVILEEIVEYHIFVAC